MNLSADLFQQLMGDAPGFVVEQPRQSPASGGHRKTAVQKVINLALHYPSAAAKTGDAARLALLTQPGADVLRRVFAAAASSDGSMARVLETLRGDPASLYLERIVAEPPLGIDTEEAAVAELTSSLENLGREAEHSANVQRIMRGERPGTGSA